MMGANRPERLSLRLVETGHVIEIEAPDVEGQVLGRSDNFKQYVPDVDLTLVDARKQGVSRRHAALVRYRDAIHVVDLQSINGTYLNDERLEPDVPAPLSEGDHLRLGNLEIMIHHTASNGAAVSSS